MNSKLLLQFPGRLQQWEDQISNPLMSVSSRLLKPKPREIKEKKGFGANLGANHPLFRFLNNFQTVELLPYRLSSLYLRTKQEIDRKSKFLQEFDDIEFELDETETKFFIEMLNEPNLKAQRFRGRAKELFFNADLTADEIPVKIKSKEEEF